MFSPIWGKGNGRGISGFAVNRGAVNRGFTVIVFSISNKHTHQVRRRDVRQSLVIVLRGTQTPGTRKLTLRLKT